VSSSAARTALTNLWWRRLPIFLEYGDLDSSLGGLGYKVIHRGIIDGVNRPRDSFVSPHPAPIGAWFALFPCRNQSVIYRAVPLLQIPSKDILIELHCSLGLICDDIEINKPEHISFALTYSYSRVNVAGG
jgi:hypothetical protein